MSTSTRPQSRGRGSGRKVNNQAYHGQLRAVYWGYSEKPILDTECPLAPPISAILRYTLPRRSKGAPFETSLALPTYISHGLVELSLSGHALTGLLDWKLRYSPPC
jgi:hypothetical protein